MQFKKIIIVTLLLFTLVLVEFSTLKAKASGNNEQLNQEKLQVEVIKLMEEAERLRIEIAKLKEETDSLKIENRAPDRNLRWLTVWFTALGGLFLGIIGIILNRTLKRAQKGKMEQEKKLGREKHILELFRELGSDTPQIRMGAASILLQQLKQVHKEKKAQNDEKKYELPMIASVLIAATKHEKEEKIQKYIADNLAISLDAIVPDKKKAPGTSESPLKTYDFQGTKLNDAWWRRIDARGVDFFRASLKKAGLKEAFLNNAVLREANLNGAILRDAHLEHTNFTKASLIKADLRNVDLSDSVINGANFRGAIFTDADLRNVDLSDSILDGADFRGAIFNKDTKIKRSQLQDAKFDDKVSTVVTIIE